MSHRLLSFILLPVVALSLGGLGQYLHELALHDGERRAAVADGAGVATTPAGDHERAPADHSKHDHERCSVCQVLASSRIDRLPLSLVAVASVDPPVHALPSDEALPHCVAVHAAAEPRAPPVQSRL